MNARALLLLGAGFVIWSLAFVVLYSMLSVGCRFGWHEADLPGGMSVQRLQLAVIFLAHMSACVVLVRRLRQADDKSFIMRAAFGTALAAAGSTAFTFGAVFVLSPCI